MKNVAVSGCTKKSDVRLGIPPPPTCGGRPYPGVTCKELGRRHGNGKALSKFSAYKVRRDGEIEAWK
jgi:hypothetical protein